MSIYSPKINTGLTIDETQLPTFTPTKINAIFPPTQQDVTDSESEVELDPLDFNVANPDTHHNHNKSMNIIQSTTHELSSNPPAIPIHQQNKVMDRHIKDLPPILSTNLTRRQSKTQQEDDKVIATQQPSFYSISETVEYQPHHLRASILEPLSKTVQQQPNSSKPAPLLIIPPPSAKDTILSPTMTPSPKDTALSPVMVDAPSPPRTDINTHGISYSLIHHPGAIKLYRDMAEKTQDERIQLDYANYLLTQQQHLVDKEKRKALEQEGVRWIRRLSKKGVGEAALMEAIWMETEQHGYKSRNGTRIDRLYHIAIQAGVPDASYYLALRKETTLGGNQTSHAYDIFRLYQKAADLKSVQGLYKMAKIYLMGELEQEQDLKKGMGYLLSATQFANTTCNEPPYALALILTNKHTKVTIPSEQIQAFGGMTKAVDYMEKSANLENIGAMNRLGHLLEYGSSGVPINIAKAFTHYQEAATKGHHLQSMLGLSRLYNGGCRGPDDSRNEQQRLTEDISGWFRSHPKDAQLSFYWCQLAAKGGLPDALYLLGWYYEIGWGVASNNQLSMEYYQQAARKGQVAAMDRLGQDTTLIHTDH
ncbi:hypothetical protein BC941DRAFT_412479 [Chlamydoabsidia padenii]|nr:hypothetical protein BC941DRAFT_412479 [Chlamydoabsidia padenii]